MALTDNLVSYWSLDEASGNAIDAHAALDLTDNNTVGATTGKVSGCRDFEASSSQYFSVAAEATLGMDGSDFTVCAWVNPESLAGFDTIMSRRNPGSGWELRANQFATAFQFNLADAVTVDGGTPSTGNWFFIVCWRSVADNKIYIQVNNGTPVEAATGGADETSTDKAFSIGARSDPSLYWDGLIDEVGVWSRALTSQERTDLYNGGSGLAYPFSSGTTSPWYHNLQTAG